MRKKSLDSVHCGVKAKAPGGRSDILQGTFLFAECVDIGLKFWQKQRACPPSNVDCGMQGQWQSVIVG